MDILEHILNGAAWGMGIFVLFFTLFIISAVLGSTCRWITKKRGDTWMSWVDFLNGDNCNPFRWAEFWAWRL